MGIENSKPKQFTPFEIQRRKEIDALWTGMRQHARIVTRAHYLSADHWEERARNMEVVKTVLGSCGLAGLGGVSFSKVLKRKAGGAIGSSSMFATGMAIIYSFSGEYMKTSRNPAALAEKYSEAGANWKELHDMIRMDQKLWLWDPNVDALALEKLHEELLDKKFQNNKYLKTEIWAYKQVKEEMKIEEEEKKNFHDKYH
ncbi:unnamed protein product [Owenia fusiformis]|uniref:Uncharacterized protein n=1 Tax=Owenia fusiformis TaxID=6347 RepID=A0A8J1Y0R6_OWEFU|nr:unnamed protein product [Owenia fusiformis]